MNKQLFVLSVSTFVGLTFLPFISFSENQNARSQSNDPIRIGLLVTQNPAHDRVSLEAVHAVQLAVEDINSTGGVNSRPVELVIKTSEGDWGSGSKKSVELIYDDEVTAIIGSLDGQNAHLVEMAIAKAQVIYIETRATEPTLTNANVPWFFRAVPSDLQQAIHLSEHIYNSYGLKQVAIISSDSYDHNMAARTFLGVIQHYEYPEPVHYTYNNNRPDFRRITESIISPETDGILYFGDPKHLTSLVSEMEKEKMNVPLYSTLSILNTSDPAMRKFVSDHVIYTCPSNENMVQRENFGARFESMYEYKPGVIASYSYDGISILLESIKQSNLQSEDLRHNLMSITGFNGVNGRISFLENGDIKENFTICGKN